MKADARLARARAVLTAGVVVLAVVWGAAVFAAAVAGLAALATLGGSESVLGTLAAPLSPLLGICACGAVLWRGRGAREAGAVALWIEERFPSLRYALVTAADPRCAASPGRAELEQVVAGTTWARRIALALARALAPPAALLAAGLLALSALPADVVARVGLPSPPDVIGIARRGARRAAHLEPLVATVTPPAYTGRRPVVLREPATIAAIAGSSVVIEVRGPASRIRATLGAAPLAVRGEPGRWLAAFEMPPEAVALRLGDGASERVVVVEPQPDSLPVVTLTSPPRDSVVREPRGTVPVAAELGDDIGLATAWFEFIVSSGERDRFTFRTGRFGGASLAGARSASRRVALSLDSLRLAPGDVLHVRAVATDGNTVAGPGVGVSETRSIRVARAGECDSISVIALPALDADTSALSQRMLIILAEALERRRPSLSRAEVVGESRRVAGDQTRLRRELADVIFVRLTGETSAEHREGEPEATAPTPEALLAAAESAASVNAGAAVDFSEDGTAVVAVNRPLLEAYHSMWEASGDLEVGEPGAALPHMRAALAAIQRSRQAERLYLRGRPPAVVVDLARVRLIGDRAGAAGDTHAARVASGGPRARLAVRLAAALLLLPDSGAAVADSLQLLRVEALGHFPRFAAALGEAVAALRSGRDATAPLVRAGAAIAGEPRAVPRLPAWEALW